MSFRPGDYIKKWQPPNDWNFNFTTCGWEHSPFELNWPFYNNTSTWREEVSEARTFAFKEEDEVTTPTFHKEGSYIIAETGCFPRMSYCTCGQILPANSRCFGPVRFDFPAPMPQQPERTTRYLIEDRREGYQGFVWCIKNHCGDFIPLEKDGSAMQYTIHKAQARKVREVK